MSDAPLDLGMAAGAEAIEHAVRAIGGLAPRFPAAQPAVALILATPGRVVVTGLGKSGLVGTKLAATFSSTGTSAFFVHAADALHGDAGSITSGDILIAISNSGETSEVVRFVTLARGRAIPIIAMTGCRGRSTLAGLADAVLDVCVDRESDPYDLVPSSSTAATAVMGDALAIAVMVARGFGPDDFHRHHPGGSLGARLGTATQGGS